MTTKRKTKHPDAEPGEWFDRPDPTDSTDTGEVGLRFTCTQCGNCCTGPTGFVLFNDKEARAMAESLGITKRAFHEKYTRDTVAGRSLTENKTGYGYDCVFLTRDEKTGMTGCSVYESRPEQCRTWPFWGSNLRTKRDWTRAAKGCPGMDSGQLHPSRHIRLTRDRVEI